MTKRRIRENLYVMLFQTAFYPQEEWEKQVNLFLEDLEGKDATEQAKEILRTRFAQICPLLPEIDQKIGEKSKGWKLERLAKADLSVLRLAVFEMLFDEDVPNPVAINEAVELAKIYGGEKSGKFVNGILAALERER